MLTELDQKIFAALHENGRASWSDLARRFSVSRVTIQNRVDAMRARNIIGGYTVVAGGNARKLGADESGTEKAFLLVQFADNGTLAGLRKLLAGSPHVRDIWCIAGEWDCFVLLCAPSLREVAKLRERIFAELSVKRIETRPVLNDSPANAGARGG